MKQRQSLHGYWRKVQQILFRRSRKFWIVSGVLFVFGVLIATAVIPKQVTFSYAEKTCANQLLLAPSLQKRAGEVPLVVSFEGGIKVGGVHLFSTKSCVAPDKQFEPGVYTTRLGIGGSWLMARHLRVTVPEPPSLMANVSDRKEISAIRPLELQLTIPDIIHDYTLEYGDKSAECRADSNVLSCAVATLGLTHGKTYTLAMTRSIRGQSEVEPVAQLELATLTPIKVKKFSVTNKQTVYKKVREVTFTTDKLLADAEVSVVRRDDKKKTPVAHTVKVADKTGKITFSEDLSRQAEYTIKITQLNGKDGSSLAEPATVTFRTSGGPKVKSASLGSSLVAQNARIILTFDQPIDASVNVDQYIKVAGVSASVVRQSATQVVVTLQNAPLCRAFTLSVDKGIKSGSNGAKSDVSWQRSSRTICGTSAVIGYSVRGRPIIAYYFGSGTKTILFTAGIHGSEPSSTATMQAWVAHLQANGHIIPSGKRVVIVPNTNPDGIATGSRNNSRNVNLGRNFPSANWKARIETASGTLPTGGGKTAGSEPETRALMALTRQLRPRVEISFHAQGSLVGANKVADSIAIGNIYAATVGYRTMYYNAEAVMGYEMTGEYEEWLGEEMGVPAILIELPTLSGNYLGSQLAALLKMLSV